MQGLNNAELFPKPIARENGVVTLVERAASSRGELRDAG